MKLLLLVLAVCTVGRCTIQSTKLLDFEYYWRDWKVDTPVPEDAVAGGVDVDGRPTYVARTVYNKRGRITPGRASPKAKRMWFESDDMEHTKTNDVDILCALNQNRLKWVVVNKHDSVDKVVGHNVLIYGGSLHFDHTTTIGRQRIGNEIQVGRVVINRGKFMSLALCRNGKCWWQNEGYEVLVYVKNESVDD